MQYLGDIAEDATIYFSWSSYTSAGASVTRATNGTISVYKDDGTTQSTAGITDTEDFDSLTGVHQVKIDTSADAFYAAAHDYTVVLSGATIDGQTVNAVLAHFSIENRNTKANVTHVGGTAQTARDLGAQLDAAVSTRAAASDLATVAGYLDTEVAAILADTNELQTDLVNGGRLDLLIDAIKAKTDNLPASPAAVGSAMTLEDGAITAAKIATAALAVAKFADDFFARLGIVAWGTAQSAGAANVVVAAGQGAQCHAGNMIIVTGSTQGYPQTRWITGVATDTVSVDAWDPTPTGTITYVVVAIAAASASTPAPVNVTQVNGTAQTAGDLAALITTIDGIVDTIVSRVVGTLAAGTHNPQSGDAYARLGAPAGASVSADIAANGLLAAGAEPTTVIGHTDTIKAKIDWLAALSRNKITQTATLQSLRNDADNSTIASAPVSDDGTTFTRGEFA